MLRVGRFVIHNACVFGIPEWYDFVEQRWVRCAIPFWRARAVRWRRMDKTCNPVEVSVLVFRRACPDICRFAVNYNCEVRKEICSFFQNVTITLPCNCWATDDNHAVFCDSIRSTSRRLEVCFDSVYDSVGLPPSARKRKHSDY